MYSYFRDYISNYYKDDEEKYEDQYEN